jgi:sugar O-acyltransferase (sialic acid O-acetyltransferase NeuD family)
MKIIYTPKVGTSDIEVKLCAIIRNNQKISIGDIICEVETSKATYDIESEYDGYIYMIHDLYENINVGSPLAIISKVQLSEVDLKIEINKFASDNDVRSLNTNVTKKAQVLIDKYEVDISSIKKEIITEKDVQELLIKAKLGDELINTRFKENDLVIVGIGGHAGMCIDLLRQESKYKIVGFIDDNVTNDEKYGLKYLGNLSRIEELAKNGLCHVILGIGFVGNLKKREKIYNYLTSFVRVPTIIHKSAIVEPSAKIDEGCQIMAGAIIGSNVLIGKNCIINSGVIVSHDSIISDGSHLTPGATLAGHVKIGRRVTVGMCATVYIGLEISDDHVIMNGKSVIGSI